MSEEERKRLEDTTAFTNSLAQQFYDFQRQTKSQIEYLEKQLTNQKTLIDANRSWIQICDSAIKSIRQDQNKELKEPLTKMKTYKFNWKFWK